VLVGIQNSISSYDSIDYVYVLEETKLIGVFSIHELFSAKPTALACDFMIDKVAYVHVHTDEPHIAQLALAQSIKAVPVVDEDVGFVGVVLADTVLQILNEEHTNYQYKATGIRRKTAHRHTDLPILSQVKGRAPWLLIGLFGGLGGAAIVNHFEHSIQEQVFVAAFIPAIVYLADAVGNQAEMLVVRALGREKNFALRHYLFREWGVTIILSILLGATMSLLSYVWLRDYSLSLVLGMSIVATTLFSVTFTVVLPWILKKLGFDPAVASGPIATVVCDISSVSIYLTIASNVL
jgi:magnesium transporter